MGEFGGGAKASTGEFVWGFQVVHHDLWDYDVAQTAAVYMEVRYARSRGDDKDGTCIVLNRLTGAPTAPVEERRSSSI